MCFQSRNGRGFRPSPHDTLQSSTLEGASKDAQSPSIITKLPNYQIAVLFFYSLGRSATIRLCNTFSIEKILLVMRHKQILSQGLIKGCSLVCCDTRSQDIVCTSADVHPVLQGNLCRVFRRYRDIQSDSDNRNGLAPDSLGFVQVHFSQ